MSPPPPILVVEDDASTRKLLEKHLTLSGHEVVGVPNGREALNVFVERFFPIVISDWIMPEVDGLELCRAIRRQESRGYVFIILLTAKNSKLDIVKGINSGADDYLTKPFSRSELLARLNSGLRILELERSLKKANAEIRLLCITDPLTGCYNRGYLAERLPQEIRRAKRYNHRLSIVLCDIDHFKRINDTYGHQVGDSILVEFVRVIQGNIREQVDWLARYGGEEFLIVLPETGLDGAQLIAERLRRAVASHAFAGPGAPLSIRASFGVTGCNPVDSDREITADMMIWHVDRHLYLAKQAGRNQVKALQI